MRRLAMSILLVLLGVIALRLAFFGGSDVRIATWNIRDFPESDRQVEATFDTIRGLGVAAVAIQEITDPARFETAARERLGPSWRCAWPSPSPRHHVGVVFDSDVLELLSTRTYTETVVYEGARPALEVRLRSRDDEAILRLIVIHLKAGGDGHDRRRQQLDALQSILVAAVETGERLLLLGDFNSTSDQDRDAVATLADATEMEWASEDLDCTSFWDRDDGCVGSALDQVLATDEPDDVEARGPCETEGCEAADRCPAFHAEVSDHCPVRVEVE